MQLLRTNWFWHLVLRASETNVQTNFDGTERRTGRHGRRVFGCLSEQRGCLDGFSKDIDGVNLLQLNVSLTPPHCVLVGQFQQCAERENDAYDRVDFNDGHVGNFG